MLARSLITLILTFVFGLQILFSNTLIIDPHLSPFISSNNLIVAQNELLNLQDHYKSSEHNSLLTCEFSDFWRLKHNYQQSFQDESTSKRILKMALRSGELAVVWYPINYMTMVLQHEVFGHGYRMRSIGSGLGKVEGYKMTYMVDKYGFHVKDAHTRFSCCRAPSFSESIAISIAGLESNSIFAENLVFSWLEKGYIDPRQASLWRSNQFACAKYIKTLKKLDGLTTIWYGSKSGHDIARYYSTLHRCYGTTNDLEHHLGELRLKANLTILLNPFTYLSCLSELSYVFFNSSIPIFGFSGEGEYWVLPAYKMGLSPFGIEDIIELFIWKKGGSPTLVYFKFGQFSSNRYTGLGIENRKLLTTEYGSFGLKGDFWYQPPLLLDSISEKDMGYEAMCDRFLDAKNQKPGISLSVIYQKSSMKHPNTSVWAQLGGKTKGFLPGESLVAAPIVKLGASYYF